MKLGSFVLIVVNLFVGAWSFSLIWNWFPAEIFGIATIGIAEALGLSLVFFFVKHKPFLTGEEGPTKAEHSMYNATARLIQYLTAAGIGYIVQFFL